MAMKLMVIQRGDLCAGCATPLPPKTNAWWDSSARNVTCTTCRPADIAAAIRIPESTKTDAPDGAATPTPQDTPAPASESGPQSLAPPEPIDHGVGGVSAQKEYDRRRAKHEKKIEEKWGTGRIGKVAKFFADEPQSTTAWAKGAAGEAQLAERLDRDLDGHATMLHDRKVPSTRGNIDHLVVAPTGIWIIDAKNYSGKVECRDVGNWRTTDQQLYVGGRSQNKLVTAMSWQSDAVREATDSIGFHAAPIHRCICFTDADWGFFSKPFTIDDVWIGWPAALVDVIQAAPTLDAAAVTTLSHHLSTWFPALR